MLIIEKVTSVYGMTNMDTTPTFWQFGVTLATVCVPFFILIGFLNTDAGYRFFHEKTKSVRRWLRPKPNQNKSEQDDAVQFEAPSVNRTLSTEEGMRRRLGESVARPQSEHRDTETHPHIKRMIEEARERKGSGFSSVTTNSSGLERRDASSRIMDTIINIKDD
jgi:ribosomal protein L13E